MKPPTLKKPVIQTVVLAAGSGERFARAGIPGPKPLIPVTNEKDPMIFYPLRLAKSVNPLAIVIATAHLADLFARGTVLPCRTVGISYQQRGPALSLLCLNGHIADDDPLIVMACDDRIEESAFNSFVRAFQQILAHDNEHTNALVMTTVLQDQKEALSSYAYVSGAHDRVSFIHEKKPTLLPARIFCGIIAFRRWDIARLAIMRMICESIESVEGEYFVAPCVNSLSRVRYFDIPRSAFVTVGTPEALTKFQEDSRVKV